MATKITTQSGNVITNPPIARFLFDDTRISVVWLLLRVWLGYTWISASLHKLSSPDWMQTGAALQGFWANQVKVPTTGSPAIAVDWYRSFIQFMLDSGSYVWFAKLVAFGEFAVGIALIIGAFVGVAAFFGAFMNWNFMMAGVASTSPLLILVALLLILAWKTAGYWGADRFLLPRLGTPWTPNRRETGAVPERKPSAA